MFEENAETILLVEIEQMLSEFPNVKISHMRDSGKESLDF